MSISPVYRHPTPAVPRPGRPRRSGSGRSHHERTPWQHDGLTAEDAAVLMQSRPEDEDELWGSRIASSIAMQRRMGTLVGRLTSINVRSVLGDTHFVSAEEQALWHAEYTRLLDALDAREAVSGPARLDIRA